MELLEQPHDRDRIGRRNQCTESETHEQTLMQPDQIEDDPCQQADHHDRQQHSNCGQGSDRPAVIDEPLEIHVQGAGEQQETQQSVHQRLIEVDLIDEALNCGTEWHARYDLLDDDHDE